VALLKRALKIAAAAVAAVLYVWFAAVHNVARARRRRAAKRAARFRGPV
jgi:hypothetical protein